MIDHIKDKMLSIHFPFEKESVNNLLIPLQIQSFISICTVDHLTDTDNLSD